MGEGARGRFRAAAIDLALERGCQRIDADAVVVRAALDRASFDREFTDLDDCLLDAYLFHTAELDRRLFASFEAEESWRDGLRAAAYAAAGFVRERPREVRFGGLVLIQAGPLIQAHRANHLQRLVDLVDAARQELDDPESLNRAVAESVLGSIYQTMVRALQTGSDTAPEAFIPELMYVAVRPYFGHEVAREELAMPPAAAAGRPKADRTT